MKKLIIALLCTAFFASTAMAKEPKSRFYDFGEQVIDGEIKKPTALYTEGRNKVKFNRLLSLKKSFLNKLMDSSRENTFK